jgi:A/G-specific adenine glycosylase
MSPVRQPVRAPYEISPETIQHISWLRRRLLSWFPAYGRSFPWREPGRTPYEVAVAEILLQRTTAARVARAYAGFVERFPSWVALAQTPLEDL